MLGVAESNLNPLMVLTEHQRSEVASLSKAEQIPLVQSSSSSKEQLPGYIKAELKNLNLKWGV